MNFYFSVTYRGGSELDYLENCSDYSDWYRDCLMQCRGGSHLYRAT